MATSAQKASGDHGSERSSASANRVQAKLNVGKAGGSYEQEADRTAEHVVSGTSQASTGHTGTQAQPVAANISRMATRKPLARLQPETTQRQPENEEAQTKLQLQEEEEAQPKLQRQEEEEAQPKLQRQEEEEAQPKLQRQAEEEEEPVQARAEPRANVRDKRQFPVLNQVEQKLFQNKGRGEALGDDTKTQMEVGFGADFSSVRVHTGSDAQSMSRDLKAQAFTHGSDIFFNSGKYEPDNLHGKALLAHELTHVVQQGAADQKIPVQQVQENNDKRSQMPPDPTDREARKLEHEPVEKSENAKKILILICFIVQVCQFLQISVDFRVPIYFKLHITFCEVTINQKTTVFITVQSSNSQYPEQSFLPLVRCT
jgi:hypothetical protein